MAIVTSQQISSYYDRYADIEITFNRAVVEATGLLLKQVHLKSLGDYWPCVPYSSSMKRAKVIANLSKDFFETIRRANNLVSLRLAFQLRTRTDPLSFFIASRVMGHNRYDAAHPNLFFLTLEFSQRPPDDFIELFGKLLDANLNAAKRREERIVVDAESMRELGLASREGVLSFNNTPVRCVIRDLSFSGAKVLLLGGSQELQGKTVALKVSFEEESGAFVLPATVVRQETVPERPDISAVALHFDEARLPFRYKMRINAYLTNSRVATLKERDSHPDRAKRAGDGQPR